MLPVMSSRADILIAAQQAMNMHHQTATGGCAECKTSYLGPCPVWTLAAEVVRLVQANIRNDPPAAQGVPTGRARSVRPLTAVGIQAGSVGAAPAATC